MSTARPIIRLVATLMMGLTTLASYAQNSEPSVDRRGLLGVLLDGQYFGDDSQGIPEGVRIAEIQPGLAADRANLQIGDVVLSVNGKAVRTVRALQIEISTKKPGSQVTLTISRENQIFQRQGILGDWFDFLVRTPIFGPFLSDVRLVRLNDQIRQQLQLPADLEGAVVAEIAQRSLYQFVFQPGAVVTRINGKPIQEIRSFDALPENPHLTLAFIEDGTQGSFTLIKELSEE